MPFYFLDLPQTARLFDVLNDHNIEARFVGGCVRDALLKKLTDDLDIAVKCDTLKLAEVLRSANIDVKLTGLKYGSITVTIDDVKFELTSLRRDIKCLGRSCKIEPVDTFEEDAVRRDFTINAMYVSQSGDLFDYFEGVADLNAHRVVFIGDPEQRIKEDYLRILRYYRFAAKLQDFSDRYGNVISRYAQNIPLLSIDRIQKELFLILQQENNLRIFEMIKNNGIFQNLDIAVYSHLSSSASLEEKSIVLFGYETLMNTFHLPRTFKRKIKEFKDSRA